MNNIGIVDNFFYSEISWSLENVIFPAKTYYSLYRRPKNSLVSRFDIQYDNNFQISHITYEEKPTATISGQSKHYEKVNAR